MECPANAPCESMRIRRTVELTCGFEIAYAEPVGSGWNREGERLVVVRCALPSDEGWAGAAAQSDVAGLHAPVRPELPGRPNLPPAAMHRCL